MTIANTPWGIKAPSHGGREGQSSYIVRFPMIVRSGIGHCGQYRKNSTAIPATNRSQSVSVFTIYASNPVCVTLRPSLPIYTNRHPHPKGVSEHPAFLPPTVTQHPSNVHLSGFRSYHLSRYIPGHLGAFPRHAPPVHDLNVPKNPPIFQSRRVHPDIHLPNSQSRTVTTHAGIMRRKRLRSAGKAHVNTC